MEPRVSAPTSSVTASTMRWTRWMVLPICVAVLAACGSTSAPTSQTDPLTAGLDAQMRGRTVEAVTDYQAVLRKDPHNKYAYYNLGLIDQLAGRAASAELYYRTALQTDPNFAPALYNLAILRTGPAAQEAVDLYRRVLKIMPGYAAAHLNLGYVLLSLKEVTAGKSELLTAEKLDPSLAPGVQATLAATK